MSDNWSGLRGRMSELEAITGVMGLLEWDQQTCMPKGGAGHRGDQLAVLSGIAHERLTADDVGRWLDGMDAELAKSPDPTRAAAVRNARRRYSRALRVPGKLVRAFTAAGADGFSTWMQARESGTFAPFQPSLERLIGLAREIADCHDDAAHPYDALLEEYDPGTTVAGLLPMFDRLGAELGTFVQATAGVEGPAPLDLTVDEPGLKALSDRIIAALGFSLEHGRLDESEHPFTVGMGPQDVRLTTHLYGADLLSTLGGTIHEAGHGMYEQGLPLTLAGTGLCEAAGMGIHESQSRFWENTIGRSMAFCRWLVPVMREQWPDLQLTAEQLYGAANRVERSLIRVKADEATYNLHIVVRFELEVALMEGRLSAAELPDAWDAAYARVLGVSADNPVDGVLQDVHWAAGLFGYFPSYTIGNLYAASMAQAMADDLPDMFAQVERGEFSNILGWLREKVHQRGHTLDAPQIFAEAVGDRDPVADLMGHLRARHGALYGVD